MSDVARLRQVLPARSQLPVSWYFDAEHFTLEKRLLFDAGANYVGHSLMVPNVGDYHTLAWTDHARVLVHNDAGIDLLSNVCRHRQAIMLEGRGNAQHIVCPLHRWTYDLKGELLGAPKAGLEPPGTPTYKRWHDMCLKFLDGRAPKYGALWMSYFPGVMLEWYPNVLVVSHLIPRSARRTTNVVEFYYPEEIALFEREFVEAQQAAYLETAIEDNVLCERMDRGRRALYEEGLDDAGPYQSPMEDAEAHFHEWLHKRLGR